MGLPNYFYHTTYYVCTMLQWKSCLFAFCWYICLPPLIFALSVKSKSSLYTHDLLFEFICDCCIYAYVYEKSNANHNDMPTISTAWPNRSAIMIFYCTIIFHVPYPFMLLHMYICKKIYSSTKRNSLMTFM